MSTYSTPAVKEILLIGGIRRLELEGLRGGVACVLVAMVFSFEVGLAG
ncbi:hypothetical protein [Arthrobacter sp. TWP1-1]